MQLRHYLLLMCCCLGSLLLPQPARSAVDSGRASFGDAVADVQPKMVKVHGAGGYRGLEAYQSGFLISADGLVLTVWSYVLDSDYVSVTLHDGRKFQGKLLGADPTLEIALLKIDATGLPHFDLAQAVSGELGTRVLAFSNLFGVATGDEPVSVLHGSVSAITTLSGRRGVFKTPYTGKIYVLDAMTNNPGAAGGALTDHRGRLLGLLGKELRNARTNSWLNYSIPIAELSAAIADLRAGKQRPPRDPEADKPANPVELTGLGIVLVPNVLERTPPYVDRVLPESPAAEAGLQPDDLILMIDEQLVRSQAAMEEEFSHLDAADELRLTVMRGDELIHVSLPGVQQPTR